ncbi:MAG: hypothetical protein LIP10_03875 [Clostridiales bacterium]|nr:hypothetical protein [Clostridiales bacterium]
MSVLIHTTIFFFAPHLDNKLILKKWEFFASQKTGIASIASGFPNAQFYHFLLSQKISKIQNLKILGQKRQVTK